MKILLFGNTKETVTRFFPNSHTIRHLTSTLRCNFDGLPQDVITFAHHKGNDDF